MKKLFASILTVLGMGFPSSVNGLLIPPPYSPRDTSPIHTPLFRKLSPNSKYNAVKSNEILSWPDHAEYHLTIRPEDTWESLTKDIQRYAENITIEELVEQAYEQARILDLVPGERLKYSDEYICSNVGYGPHNLYNLF